MQNESIIYLDHAATTKINPEVLYAMKPYLEYQFGNPSSLYSLSKSIKNQLSQCREYIGKSIGAKEQEIFFTSGGSEADNWALKGVMEANREKGKHLITTKIEHHAILHSGKFLEALGYEVTYIDVDEFGVIKMDELKKAIRKDTVLISVMFANNEIGTIEPIEEIGKLAKMNQIYFHTDAVQAFGHIPIDVNKYNIDLLSVSAHKINGPKGIGFLYIRDGIKIHNLIHGGNQENGLRAGTENVAGIVGMAKAVELKEANRKEKGNNLEKLRDYVIDRLLLEVPYCRLNGHKVNRLPGNINISFQFIESDAILVLLDEKGIMASSGSACNSGYVKISHVLKAIGLSDEVSKGTLRLTLDEENTYEEMDYVIFTLKELVERLRKESPIYEDFLGINKLDVATPHKVN